MKKKIICILCMLLFLCVYFYGSEKKEAVIKRNNSANHPAFFKFYSEKNPISNMSTIPGTNINLANYRFLFLGLGIVGTICVVSGLPLTIAGAAIPPGALYNYYYHLDQKYVLLAVGVTLLVCGLPLMIVGWVLFGLSYKKGSIVRNKTSISMLMEYHENKTQSLGLRVRF